MSCIAGSAILAAGMGSVTRVTKMVSITISAILCLTFTTTRKSFRNTGRRRSSTSPSFTSFHSVFHSFHGLMNSINWPASSIWVFIAQLGEHCSANAEATGSNPIEAPKNFFSGYFRNCLNCDSLRWSHTHFICIPAVHIISFSVSFLSRVDELNKLASLQYMGLHSSVGRALQR